jgi:hypothetical protein
MEGKVKIPALQPATNKEPLRQPQPNVRLDLAIKAPPALLQAPTLPDPTQPPPPAPKTDRLHLLLLHLQNPPFLTRTPHNPTD